MLAVIVGRHTQNKMKSIVGLTLLLLISCQGRQENAAVADKLNSVRSSEVVKIQQDSLFTLDINVDENFVKINAPKELDFELPDSSAKTEPFKTGDFNADNKKDVMVYLGACGTGGCMYGLFLNQYDNYYKLAFMDYLKGAEFKTDKNGLWIIKSFEEIEPYNPSKLQVSNFKFDKGKYYYHLDTTFVHHDTIDD